MHNNDNGSRSWLHWRLPADEHYHNLQPDSYDRKAYRLPRLQPSHNYRGAGALVGWDRPTDPEGYLRPRNDTNYNHVTRLCDVNTVFYGCPIALKVVYEQVLEKIFPRDCMFEARVLGSGSVTCLHLEGSRVQQNVIDYVRIPLSYLGHPRL